ncbi:hypothetical protein EH223_04925 [candidate division KSB1 bacterium]|nr:glycosyltransferase family 4 protein [candidate division KSB1 bacterium]RQW05379.1 MAG: hypothetical protein EH223_04925 [candidate division KSB1 bacterium]
MKTVLIITYYWPPAGGPGVQRVLKFARYLPHFGWSPVILTVTNGEYPAIDETLQKDIDADVIVHKTRSFEPFVLYRLLTGQKSDTKISTFVLTEDSQGGFARRFASFLRGNLFIPDARIGWLPFAVKAGWRILKAQNIDLFFSTAPPMTTHLIAKSLAKKSGLPWVADFRDPWTDVFYYHTLKRTRPAVALDRHLEQSVLRSANVLVTVSPTLQKLFVAKTATTCHVIANGYDEDDFKERAAAPNDNKLHVVHAGHLAINQNPLGLWAALHQLTQEDDTLSQKLQLDFYGSIHSRIRQSLDDLGLLPICKFYSYIPHDQLVAVMKRATLLFFVVPSTSYAKGILTSKLFDYMGAGRPILGIGPEDGDAALILQQTRVGKMIDPAHQEEIANFIHLVLEKQKMFSIERRTSPYKRERLTQSLAEIFDRCVTVSRLI